MTTTVTTHVPSSTSESTRADRATSDARGAVRNPPFRVGVLSPHNSKETKAILNAVKALGHEPVWVRETNLVSSVEDGEFDIRPAVDVLVNRTLVTKSDRPMEALQPAALYETTAPVVNPPRAVQTAVQKYQAAARLSAAGIPVPDAYFARSPGRFSEWTEHLAPDAVYKRTVGTNGKRMRRVAGEDPVHPELRGGQAFLQEFLDADEGRPYDVRAYVVDGELVGAMRRYAPEGDWRTNVALGGEVEDATDDLGAVPRQRAKRATEVLDLDVAGVDLIPADGEWYVLEVNATAGFKGLFEATGVSVAPFIARAAIERVGGEVGTERVLEIAGELDDAVPACKPDPPDRAEDDAVIGYTVPTLVRGNAGSERTIAKSDTGADRTSVDVSLAGRVGAGPIEGTTEVRSGTGRGTETRPLVELDLWIDGRWRTVTAGVSDRSRMRYSVLLGRDVLDEYTIDMSRRAEE